LPDEFRLPGNEVYIRKLGNAIILISCRAPWQSLTDSLNAFSDDFVEDRAQPNQPAREDILK